MADNARVQIEFDIWSYRTYSF